MVRITRQEYENPDAVEGLPENIIQAINMWRSRQGSLSKKVDDAVNECGLGSFQAMFLQKLGQLPNSDQYQNEVKEWDQRLDRVNDKDLRSLVIELIQNAMDIDATNIEIRFNADDELFFQHTGKPWEVMQLAAVDQFISTKKGDISTIGQFGVGLKYWWHHFETFEVRYYDVQGIHKIVYAHGFNPTECYYEYEEINHDLSEVTEFAFKGLLQTMLPEMIEKFEQFRDSEIPLLSGRVKESMPNLIPKNEDSFSLSVTTLNPESTEIYNINQQLITYSETEEVGPDFVPCVSTFWSDVDSGEDEPARILSFKVRINQILYDIGDSNKSSLIFLLRRYRKWVRDEYKQFSRDTDEEIVNQRIDNMFNDFLIQFHYNPATSRGYPSQMFVASEQTIWPSVFTVDGPWKLTEDRLQLDSMLNRVPGNDHLCNRSRNSTLSKIAGFAYLKVIGNIICNWENIGINFSQIRELLFGYQEIKNNVNEFQWGNISIDNIIKEFPDYFSGSHNPSEALQLLWESLAENEDNQALLWLSSSMHEDIFSVTLDNGIRIPLTNTDGYEPLGSSEICQNLGEGVPESVIQWLNENPQHGNLLARVGARRNDQTLMFLPENAMLFPAEFESDDHRNITNQMYDLLENVCEQNELNFDEVTFELDEDQLGLNEDVNRREIGMKNHSTFCNDLELEAFQTSTVCADSAELRALHDLIVGNNPRRLDANVVVVSLEEEGTFMLRIPASNHAFALLIGDANAAIPCEIRLDKNRSRVIGLMELKYWKWGEDEIDQLPFIHIHDEQHHWWGELFDSAMLNGDLENDIPRSTFGVEELDGRGVELTGGWRSVNLGLNEQETAEFAKRMTPFVIQSISPEHVALGHHIDDIPEFFLHKGLRVRLIGGPAEEEANFTQLPPHARAVDRNLNTEFSNNLIPPRLLQLSLDINGEYNSFQVKPESYNNRMVLTEGTTVRPSAILTINGPERLLERKLENTTDLQERLNLWRGWREYLRTADNEDENINSISLSEAYDLVFGSDGGNSEYRVHTRRIWIREVPNMPTPLNDNDSPRLRNSEVFNPLTESKIIPFYYPENLLRSLNFTLYENELESWIPCLEGFELQDDNFAFNFLHLTEEEIQLLDVDNGYPFARSVRELFENLNTDDVDHNLAHLEVIIHLWERRLIGDVWSQITNNRHNRTWCKLLIDSVEDDRPDFVTNEFIDFLSREELNHSERWDEFKANFARMTQEGWQIARAAYLGDLMIPSIRFENDRHVVEFVTSLGDFLEEEEQSYIDKAEFDIYKGIDNGGNLIRINNSKYYLDGFFVDRIRAFEDNFEIQRQSLEDILFQHNDVPALVFGEEVENLSYLGGMLIRYGTQLNPEFRNIEGIEIDFIGSNPVRFSYDENARSLIVYTIERVELTIDQHEWLMNQLRIRLGALVDPNPEEVNELDPWYWQGRSEADTAEAKLEFARKYCAISRIEQIHPNGYDAFENLDQLRGHLDRLVQLYTNRDSLLNNTILHAKQHYRGMQTIRTAGIIFAADVEQRLESPISIPYYMVGNRRNDLGQRALGDTIYVGISENQVFTRFTENYPNGDAYDLAPNAVQIIEERLFAEGEQGWFGCEELQCLFTFENLFITPRQGDYHDACLWRVHALHILAFLKAGQFRWGYE